MNKKTLELMLKTGETILFQSPEDKYFMKVGGAVKDKYGDYRRSVWCKKKEECDNNIGCFGGYPIDDLLEYDFISNEPYSFGEPVPVGTKVEIIETGEIREIISENNGLYEMKIDFNHPCITMYINSEQFSRQEFRIHFEEEIEEMTKEEKEMIKILKEKGFKIIKE